MPIRMPAYKSPAAHQELSLAPLDVDAEVAGVQRFIEQTKAAAIPTAIARSIAHFAPPSSAVHAQVAQADAEEAAIRADLAYNEAKRSGQLMRDEISRAQAIERQWGVK